LHRPLPPQERADLSAKEGRKRTVRKAGCCRAQDKERRGRTQKTYGPAGEKRAIIKEGSHKDSTVRSQRTIEGGRIVRKKGGNVDACSTNSKINLSPIESSLLKGDNSLGSGKSTSWVQGRMGRRTLEQGIIPSYHLHRGTMCAE